MPPEFRNEPVKDFASDEAARAAQKAALDAFRPVDCPLVIGGRRVITKAKIVSRNPCAPREIVGRASKADRPIVRRAIQIAHEAFLTWSEVPLEWRAETIFKAAALMRERRWELNATLILEVGKSWTEADADTAEAIDFCEFYGREMLRIAGENSVTPVAGEENRLVYRPLGVGSVIAPWNFPNAILTGMTAAAIVTGNTVVLKPASTAPVIGYKVFGILEQAGLPEGVVNYVPCGGAESGDLLADHPLVRFVAFTGSKTVGVRLFERAARVRRGQRWLKRTIAEMGGKDAIVVDEDADLDAAATGIVQSAFGFQGQKCSACSRAIVVEKVYDDVLERVLRMTRELRMGDVRDPAVQVGPVVSAAQRKSVLSYVRLGRGEGRLLAGGRKGAGPGWFVEPTIFAEVPDRGRLAQEEIFGPVLAFIRARDYADAMRIANGTEYGLTGAFYGQERRERAKREFRVGNLYVNRKCTGALVGAHPFGGFGMSGTNSKAGGRDYLKLFLDAQSISERL